MGAEPMIHRPDYNPTHAIASMLTLLPRFPLDCTIARSFDFAIARFRGIAIPFDAMVAGIGIILLSLAAADPTWTDAHRTHRGDDRSLPSTRGAISSSAFVQQRLRSSLEYAVPLIAFAIGISRLTGQPV